MTTTHWQIPPSVLRLLATVPATVPVVLLMRHSVRGYLPPGDAGYTLPITDVGETLARDLGTALGRRLTTLHASPILRFVQTADALRVGAEVDVPIVEDRLLGDPGVYVVDDHRAGALWRERGHKKVMEHLVSGDGALPGLADPAPAARYLVSHMVAAAGTRPGIHVFVTHDSLVTATAARLLDEPLGPDDWPWYLEAAFFWREGTTVRTAYRGRTGSRPIGDLAQLDERHAIDFARREAAAVLGPDVGARFFVAGGAFKSLLTGRPPRDLDLWAPSAEDRAMLLSLLAARGAQKLQDGPFADTFAVGQRTVGLSRKTEPPTLEQRLARFDLALSAVGTEHHPDGRWTAIVHPLARTSVARREVLLLEPLVNWPFALATLSRLRRYAAELSFGVPPEQEAVVWRVFDAQSPDGQQDMRRRFDQTDIGGYGVREEALARLGR